MLSRREEERRERKREERGEKSIYCQKSNKLMNIEVQKRSSLVGEHVDAKLASF